jgi:inorganic triphosphatase YgiF
MQALNPTIMNKETEIKLRVSRTTLAAGDHPLLKNATRGWEQRELFNQYFDTPERTWLRPRLPAFAVSGVFIEP